MNLSASNSTHCLKNIFLQRISAITSAFAGQPLVKTANSIIQIPQENITNRMVSLFSIPDDVLIRILSTYTLSELITIQRTCKEFCRIIGSIITKLNTAPEVLTYLCNLRLTVLDRFLAYLSVNNLLPLPDPRADVRRHLQHRRMQDILDKTSGFPLENFGLNQAIVEIKADARAFISLIKELLINTINIIGVIIGCVCYANLAILLLRMATFNSANDKSTDGKICLSFAIFGIVGILTSRQYLPYPLEQASFRKFLSLGVFITSLAYMVAAFCVVAYMVSFSKS